MSEERIETYEKSRIESNFEFIERERKLIKSFKEREHEHYDRILICMQNIHDSWEKILKSKERQLKSQKSMLKSLTKLRDNYLEHI